MKFVTLVAALAAAAIPAAFGLTINTPSGVVECEPTQLSWSGGTAPYYLSLLNAGQTGGPAIEQLGTLNGTTYTWTVNLESGTSFTISLKDSTGASAYSDIVTVQPGSSTSCIGSGQPSVSSASGSTPTSGSGTTPVGSTAGAGSTTAGASASSAASTPSSSTSTHSSSAGRLSVSSAFGVAGVMGLVGAALF